MLYETVSYSVADRVATVAMNRPEARNALSDQLLDDLIAALSAAKSPASASVPPRMPSR